MKPIITSARPSDVRPTLRAGGSRRRTAEEPRACRAGRSYTVYGVEDSVANAMPRLSEAEPDARRRQRVRQEPWPTRLRTWLERSGLTTMWNK